jgi:hypothetical protein
MKQLFYCMVFIHICRQAGTKGSEYLQTQIKFIKKHSGPQRIQINSSLIVLICKVIFSFKRREGDVQYIVCMYFFVCACTTHMCIICGSMGVHET